MPARHGANGPPLCSPKRCRLRRVFARRAPGPSRSSDWMPIAPQLRRIHAPRELRRLLADRLMSLLSSVETKDWVWFEEGLAYDNARLPQALIVTGISAGVPAYVAAGLRSLRWLMTLQTTAAGHFRPVGSESFGDKRTPPRPFDQQPLEASGDDLGLSRRVARRWRSEMEGRGGAGIRVVSRQQRSVGAAGRSRNGQLPRWPASRPCEREPGRRVRRVLSSRPRGDSSACPHRRQSHEARAACARLCAS